MSVFNSILHSSKYKQRLLQLPVMEAAEANEGGLEAAAILFFLVCFLISFMYLVLSDPYLMKALAAFIINGLDAVNNFKL